MVKKEFNIGVCAKDLKGDLDGNLIWLSENGFNSFQVWKHQIQSSFKNAKELLLRVKDLGLEISAVGGGPNLVDPRESSSALEQFKSFIELSVELECCIVSAETKMLPRGLSTAEGWNLCEANVAKICEFAQQSGVDLAIECAGPCFIKDHHDWWELQHRVDNPALKVNFDAANIAWAREDPLNACTSLLSEIVHTHIKDISFLPEIYQMEHEELQDCVLGDGLINYPPIIKTLLKSDYHGCFCIEMHSGDLDRRQAILSSKSRLIQLLNKTANDLSPS